MVIKVNETDISNNVQFLKGVGPSKALLLNKLGIYSIKDLIEHFPRSYEDRTKIKKIAELTDGKMSLFIATINGDIKAQRVRKNLCIYSTFAFDDTADCKLTWFNQKYIKTRIKSGIKYIFYGKAQYEYGRFQIENPLIFNLSELNTIKGIYPIYTLTSGITQNYLFKLIRSIYECGFNIEDIFNLEFRKKYNLVDINYALKNIHFPTNFDSIEKSRNRIIFEELFLLQLALMTLKNNSLGVKKDHKYSDLSIAEFLKLLPFELTKAQNRVINEILDDFKSENVMNRLVQGDVGCGKTMVAAVAMYVAVKNGHQASLMAPTTILANQHYNELKGYFSKIGINVDIITSSTTKKNKENIIKRLKDKEIDILIGTHSIIEDNIEFNDLSLVITDEQHRFGVNQRMKLSNKGKNVDTLVMTATPIPRSLAIILYGDLDLSIIDEMPPGRTPVKTFVINSSYQERLNIFLKKNIDEGRQVYVVCPLVENNETLDLTSVEQLYEIYKNEYFKEYCVEFLHGKMKNKEKDEIMQRFKENKINILISTTVIEVGISVSNATVMVVENADRFGLAALHQLRGRVGRGNFESYCILKSDNKSQKSRERLRIMEKSNDGFKIAQKDLELRGPGDFFGIRQSGLPEFKLADLLKDMEILKKSQEAAKSLIKSDKNLKNEENLKIKKALFDKFGNYLTNIAT